MDNWNERIAQQEKEVDDAFRSRFAHQFISRKVNGHSYKIEVSIGKGWYKMFANLCQEVDDFFGHDMGYPTRGFRWVQVKEKFGTLRAYYDVDKLDGKGSEKLREIIDKYEKMSAKTCEECGEVGELRNATGWYTTKCDKHYEELRKERKERFGEDD